MVILKASLRLYTLPQRFKKKKKKQWWGGGGEKGMVTLCVHFALALFTSKQNRAALNSAPDINIAKQAELASLSLNQCLTPPRPLRLYFAHNPDILETPVITHLRFLWHPSSVFATPPTNLHPTVFFHGTHLTPFLLIVSAVLLLCWGQWQWSDIWHPLHQWEWAFRPWIAHISLFLPFGMRVNKTSAFSPLSAYSPHVTCLLHAHESLFKPHGVCVRPFNGHEMPSSLCFCKYTRVCWFMCLFTLSTGWWRQTASSMDWSWDGRSLLFLQT